MRAQAEPETPPRPGEPAAGRDSASGGAQGWVGGDQVPGGPRLAPPPGLGAPREVRRDPASPETPERGAGPVEPGPPAGRV